MTRIGFGSGWLIALLLLGGAAQPYPASAQAPAVPPPATGVTVATPGGDATVIADRLEEIGADRLVIATGNVEITRGTTRLTADRVEVNRETGVAVATGRVIFYDGPDRLTGERIDYNLRTGTGVVHQGAGQAPPYYRIGGERMERLDESRYVIRRGIFTTCEDDPPTWSFRFGSATADLEDYVYGTDASFWVKNVPLIPFIPFFAAAIRRERQTGFLFPRFGSSTRKGMFAEIPFFWAISESQDALITFDAYERRGYGGNIDYRYVLSETHQGNIGLFYLNESQRKSFERPIGSDAAPEHDEHRAWWRIRHDWLAPAGVVFKADVNGVSDDFLFRDYSDLLRDRSLQRTDSNVFLTKSWSTWNLVANAFWYQDLTTRRPTELYRLPDIRLQAPRQEWEAVPGMLYEVEASAVNFVRDVGSDGLRGDVRPRLARPVSVFGFFTVTPFAGARLTGYDTTVTGTRTTRDGGFAVEVTKREPQLREVFELGSDFEARAARIFDVGGWSGIDALLHSLEPRVNFTWLDGQGLIRRRSSGGTKGSRLPQWDGIDSVSETTSVSYSLTNRLRARTIAPEDTEPDRWELARFTLGHSYDLINAVRPLGNVTGDLIVDPGRILSFRADASYNVYGEGLKTANTDLVLRAPRLAATVGTRQIRDEVVTDPSGLHKSRTTTNFLQGTVAAEITRHLAGRFTTNWDTRADVFVENRFAVDFKWQCWAVTVEYVSRHNDEDVLQFSLNLLGIGAPLTTGTRVGVFGGANTGGGAARVEALR